MEIRAREILRSLASQLQELSESVSSPIEVRPELTLISEGWLAGRIACWPTGAFRNRRISLVSSRLPERRDLCSWWYDILRTTCARCDPKTESILTVPGTTCFEPAVRASELFGIPRIEIEIPKDTSLDSSKGFDWCRTEIENWRSNGKQNELVTPVILSPRFTDDFNSNCTVDAPLRDVVSFAFADRVVVLHSRTKGIVRSLSQQHLQQPDPCIVMLAQTSHQSDYDQKLIDQAAVPWLLFDDDQATASDLETQSDAETLLTKAPTQSLDSVLADDGPVSRPEEWLCHWTRPFRSAWPDQSPDEFLDELILGCKTADRSALAALIRITQQQKLIASVARQDEPPTVSLTAVPLAEFRQRRIFRGHRRRHDFEPYGVAIHKSALIKLGAKPVQYLEREPSEAEHQSVVESEAATDAHCPFLQPKFDRTGKIDWSREKEWRLPGDLKLSGISRSDVQVFVNDEIEKAKLERLCPWPVIVVPKGKLPANRSD